MQAAALEGERVLVLEDEPVIGIDLQEALESEGANVVLARTMPEALQYANCPALSAGVLDFRIGSDHAEPVCEALSRRRVPFIFFTGMAERPMSRWPGAPVVQKPASSSAIVGALKFALSADTREIVVEPQSDQKDHSIARIDQLIVEGEERILRMGRAIARLQAMGFDNSAGEMVLATMTKIVESMRVHRRIAASGSWRPPVC